MGECLHPTDAIVVTPREGAMCEACGGKVDWSKDPETNAAPTQVKHGTRNQYNKGCRCQECKAETARYHRERRAEKKQRNPERDESLEHGTYSTYTNHRCRCEKCCQANHDYHQGRKAKPTRWATYSPKKRQRADAKINESEGGSV